jgi:hypothetical protein
VGKEKTWGVGEREAPARTPQNPFPTTQVLARSGDVEYNEANGCSIRTRGTRYAVTLGSRVCSRITQEGEIGRRKIEIPPEELQELYVAQELSSIEIASRYGCRGQAIINRLHEYDIPVRDRASASAIAKIVHPHKDRQTTSRKDLWRLNIHRKQALLALFDLLAPYLKHARRRQDMERARANIAKRNRKQEARGVK